MIEIPEAAVLARQINADLCGKTTSHVVAGQTKHTFAWYSGDPTAYPALLDGKTMGEAANHGGMVEIRVEDMVLLFTDGINLRFHKPGEKQPPKHQMLIEFDDGSALSATVSMYGGLWCFKHGTDDNPYYKAAKEKPSPLSKGFSRGYFEGLFLPEHGKMPLKAFLATQQRIPGLGNGVLQDILYHAKLHPKSKVATLDESSKEALFHSIKTTLRAMTDQGGRDTERDLFGDAGGYMTRVSKNTVGTACALCGSNIQKQSFLGGSIYFCPGCQVA